MVVRVAATALGVLAMAVVAYYVAWALCNLLVVVVGTIQFRRLSNESAPPTSGPPLTIAVPAYNEAATVVPCVEALLSSSYPLSVVLVDDGSTDGTFDRVAEAFDLTLIDDTPATNARAYTAEGVPLTVLTQDNRGKSAALNRALSRCETPLFGVVDADTVVDSGAVARLATPFEESAVVGTGGSFRVAEPPSTPDADVRQSLSRPWFERFQALDHLRVFVLRQLGRASAGMMVQIFGACCVFRTDLVREVDGFSDVHAEDFELAVALQRHCADVGRACRFVHVPDAVAWTTVPRDVTELNEQRQRWFRGTAETLACHRQMLGRPRYGRIGLFALPYVVFGELLWVLVEGLGYLLVPAAWVGGVISTPVFVVFGLTTLLIGPLASAIAILATGSHNAGYDAADRRSLLVTAAVERLFWRPSQVFLGTYSVLDEMR